MSAQTARQQEREKKAAARERLREAQQAATAAPSLTVSREEFFQAVFHDIRDDEYLWLCEFRGDPGTTKAWGGHRALLSDLGDPSPKLNHYYSVASFRATAAGRKIAEASRLHVLVLDDPEERMNLPPSFVIATSWDSHQAGYIFETPLDLTDEVDLERAKALHMAAPGLPVDPSGNNIVRYVRPPSGMNLKEKHARNGEAPACRILEWNPDRRYTIDQLEKMTAGSEKKKRQQKQGDTKKKKGNGKKPPVDIAKELKAIMTSESYHEPCIRVAAACVAKGMDSDAIITMIEAAFLAAGNKRDEWQARYDDIHRSVVSAVNKYSGPTLKELLEMEDVVGTDKVATSVPAMPEDLLTPPGMLKDLADLIVEQAIIPQPIFALGAGLSTVSALTQNRVSVGGLHTRLNLNIGLVGETGCGKENYRAVPRKIAEAIRCELKVRDGFASSPALLQSLNRDPCLMFAPDELGIVFSQAFREGGSSHDILMWKEIMACYGLADGIHAGRAYADRRNNIPAIPYPFINVLGATTPRSLLEGLSSRQVEDGTLNRFLFLETVEKPPKRRERPPALVVPKALQEALSRVERIPGTVEAPLNMAFTEDAYEAYWGLEDHFSTQATRSGVPELWHRAHEYVAKLAGVVALMMEENQAALQARHQRDMEAIMEGDPFEPAEPMEPLSVPLGAIEWAQGVVEHSLRCLVIRCKRDMAENEYHREEKKVLGLIARAKEFNDKNETVQSWLSKGVMPRGILSKLSHMKARDLDGVLDSLEEQAAIAKVEKEKKGPGRKMTYFKLTQRGREILFGE